MRKLLYAFSPALFCFFIFSLTASLELEQRFPAPSATDAKEADKTIEQLARNEVLSLSPKELAIFIWDLFKRGRQENFSYFNSNPKTLTAEQAKFPATILLHGHGSNQGEWLPFLRTFEKKQISYPVFTLEYPQESTKANLMKKIEEIKELYFQAGEGSVGLYLVGHSLGGITSADYAYDKDSWIPGTEVLKVISVAGRLRNVEIPQLTPYYAYCYPLLPFIDGIWQKIEANRGIVALYAIAAAEDWLLPLESVLVGDTKNSVIPDVGHALITRKTEAVQTIISWLYP